MRFFLPATLVWLAAHAWLALRLVRPLERPWARRGGALGIALLALSPVFGYLLPGAGLSLGNGAWAFAIHATMGLSSILVVFVGLSEIFRVGLALGRRVGFPQAEALPSPARRAFFRQVADLGVLGTTFVSTGVGVSTALRGPSLREIEVPIAGLDPRLSGFRIAQVSDLHVGPLIRRSYVEHVAALVEEARADLVAFTGDMVEALATEIEGELAPLSALTARHGKFFVTGNHEYYWDGPAWCRAFERLGCVVLNNAHRVIEHDGAELVVGGVTDHRAGRRIPAHASDPEAAFAGAKAGVPRLLLAHQPRSVFAAADVGVDLQLSGHTHGGQYFPMNVLVHLFQPYVRGLHAHGPTWIYVNRGAGYFGPPLRGGEPSEVALVRLVRA